MGGLLRVMFETGLSHCESSSKPLSVNLARPALPAAQIVMVTTWELKRKRLAADLCHM